MFKSTSTPTYTALLSISTNAGGFGDFYTMKRSGLNKEFLLAKLLKFMEDEQLRSPDYY
jgi:hypothetical protein